MTTNYVKVTKPTSENISEVVRVLGSAEPHTEWAEGLLAQADENHIVVPLDQASFPGDKLVVINGNVFAFVD